MAAALPTGAACNVTTVCLLPLENGSQSNMGRYTGPVCRLCRREGVKLFLKSLRCDSPKCAIERRGDQQPGMHIVKRRKISDYGSPLREKKKGKRYYGGFQRPFRAPLVNSRRCSGTKRRPLKI